MKLLIEMPADEPMRTIFVGLTNTIAKHESGLEKQTRALQEMARVVRQYELAAVELQATARAAAHTISSQREMLKQYRSFAGKLERRLKEAKT